MTAFLEVKPAALKFKTSPRIPARLLEGPGIDIAKSHGNTTISVDFEGLERDDEPSNFSSLYAVTWDDQADAPVLVPAPKLKGEKGDVGNAFVNLGWGEGEVPIQDVIESSHNLRVAANVRAEVNYFDFLHASGRTATVREQIYNGTYTGDQTAEWTAFRNALASVHAAGGRATGYIPGAPTIYKTGSQNFAIDYLTLKSDGIVQIHSTDTNPAFLINGIGLGPFGAGVIDMNVSNIMGFAPLSQYGIRITTAHHSIFDRMVARAALKYGVSFEDSVVSTLRRPEGFIWDVAPEVAIRMGGAVSPGAGWCIIEAPLAEHCAAGLQIDYAHGTTITGGSIENCANVGLSMTAGAFYSTIVGLDLEANPNIDLYCLGRFNSFFGIQSQKQVYFDGGASENKLIGSTCDTISLGASTFKNLISGNTYNQGGTGFLNDLGTNNRIRDCSDRFGGWYPS